MYLSASRREHTPALEMKRLSLMSSSFCVDLTVSFLSVERPSSLRISCREGRLSPLRVSFLPLSLFSPWREEEEALPAAALSSPRVRLRVIPGCEKRDPPAGEPDPREKERCPGAEEPDPREKERCPGAEEPDPREKERCPDSDEPDPRVKERCSGADERDPGVKERGPPEEGRKPLPLLSPPEKPPCRLRFGFPGRFSLPGVKDPPGRRGPSDEDLCNRLPPGADGSLPAALPVAFPRPLFPP